MFNNFTNKKEMDKYFGLTQEEAIIKYLESNDDKFKSEIYELLLMEPFKQMVLGIVNSYLRFVDEAQKNTIVTETLTYIYNNINKFQPNKNGTAYDYFYVLAKTRIFNLHKETIKQMNKYYITLSPIYNGQRSGSEEAMLIDLVRIFFDRHFDENDNKDILINTLKHYGILRPIENKKKH